MCSFYQGLYGLGLIKKGKKYDRRRRSAKTLTQEEILRRYCKDIIGDIMEI